MDAVTRPTRMQAAPPSCSGDGDSSRSNAAKTTEHTGWNVSRIDVVTAGRRGSDVEIRSQPSTCDDSASRINQPVADHDGVRSRSPTTAPIAAQPSAAANVAVKSGPAGRRKSRLPSRSASRKPEYAIAVVTP